MLTQDFAALLLAGGKSQRMGQDKAFLEWQEQSLWQIQLNKLHSLQPARLLLSCREQQRLKFDRVDSSIEWLIDPPDFQLGPLGIIYRALKQVHSPLIVLAVDMPTMNTQFLRSELIAALSCNRGRCFSTALGLEPLAALYIPQMLTIMEISLAAEQYSLQTFWRECIRQDLAEIRAVSQTEECLFSNCNTPTEWEHEKGRSHGPA